MIVMNYPRIKIDSSVNGILDPCWMVFRSFDWLDFCLEERRLTLRVEKDFTLRSNYSDMLLATWYFSVSLDSIGIPLLHQLWGISQMKALRLLATVSLKSLLLRARYPRPQRKGTMLAGLRVDLIAGGAAQPGSRRLSEWTVL